MRSISPDLDGNHFTVASWRERVAALIQREARRTNAFLSANSETIRRTLDDPSTGPRFIVNIPADALLSFLQEGSYRNAYDRPTVAGKRRAPSRTRRRIDQLLGLGNQARRTYFGAVATGGTGIRFYGQYTLVLRPESVDATTRLFDRNSYDLLWSPLADVADARRVVRALQGTWKRDLIDMLTVKLLPTLSGVQRLVTAGALSEAILHDEDFVEAHRLGSFAPGDLEEIRQAPEDQLISLQIEERRRAGAPPSLVELIWKNRRAEVQRRIRSAGIKTRVVASSSRTDRWR